jgi:hypothetical protein
MKSILKTLLILAAAGGLVALLLAAGCSDDDDGGTNSTDNRDEWTVIVYGAGNNSDDTLGGESMVINSVQALEKADTTATVNVVAMVASGATGGVGRYYEVAYHPNDTGDQISSTMKQDLGATDVSSAQALRDFLNWAMTNYAAKRYLLVIDGPGSGWRGCCSDYINGSGTSMSLSTLQSTLSQALSQHGGGKFEIVAFTGHSMGTIEVAYELRDVANYMVGSEFDSSHSAVFGWQTWLDALVDNPTNDGNTVSQSIVNASYAAANATNPQTSMHLSAIAVSGIGNLATKLDMLGDTLVANGSNYWSTIEQLRAASQDLNFDSVYVDIKMLAQLIQSQSGLNSVASIVAAAESVEQAADSTVILPKSNVSNTRARSLAVYYPDTTANYDSTEYAAIDFQQTGWTEYLSSYVNGFQSQGQISLTVTIEPAGSGTVTKDPAQDTYSPGQSVGLTATPDSGFAWDHWLYQGDTFGFNPISFNFQEDDSNEVITANFVDSTELRVVTLRGTISWSGNTLTNPVLLLLDSALNVIQAAWSLDGGSTTDFEVQFLTSEVPSSYIHATDDLDGDLTVFEEGEPFGCYNADGDNLCDFVGYSSGQVIPDINLAIGVPAAPQGPPVLQIERSLSLAR